MVMRPHHLLCTQGYSGKGYSQEFVRNMDHWVKRLRNREGFRVRENGLAYAAGIRQGDVVTRINEENISDLNSYLRAVYADAPVFTFEYIRGGETLTGTINND